jgi:hypothetical protein
MGLECNGVDLAVQHHVIEDELIRELRTIDRNRFFVRLGFKSLKTFCINALRFSPTQAQRIVLRVRKENHADNITQIFGVRQIPIPNKAKRLSPRSIKIFE